MLSLKPADDELKAGIVGACWYLDPLKFENRASLFSKKIFKSERTISKWVDMNPSSSFEGVKSWVLGSGEFLDISAYALACATLPSNLPLYLVFNDTLFTRHPWRLISRRLTGISDSISTFPLPAAAAVIHPNSDLLLVDSRNATHRHLSTFCLLLNNTGFKLFNELLATLPASAESGAIQNWIDIRVAAYPALKSLLHVHLFGPMTPWSWRHHDPKLFQRKAVTVIFEYIFTAELLTRGAGMPINQGLGYRILSRLGAHG